MGQVIRQVGQFLTNVKPVLVYGVHNVKDVVRRALEDEGTVPVLADLRQNVAAAESSGAAILASRLQHKRELNRLANEARVT